MTGIETQIPCPRATRCNFPFDCHKSHVKNYPPRYEENASKREKIYPSIYLFIHLPSLSWWDAIGNASPTGHTRTHKEWTAVGLTQDYLCLTCLSPSAACCSWPSRCFSLSFFLSFSSSLFHTHLTHAHTYTAPHHTHLCVLVCTHTHLSATQYIVIKRHCIWSMDQTDVAV